MTISGPVLLLAALAAAPDAALIEAASATLRGPSTAAAQLAPTLSLAQAFQSLPVAGDAFRDSETAAASPVLLAQQHRRRPWPFPIRHPVARRASAIAAGAFVGFLAGAFGSSVACYHAGCQQWQAVWLGGSGGAVAGGWLASKHAR